jgi:hypothetical protein
LTAKATSSLGVQVAFKPTSGSPCGAVVGDPSLVKCELGGLAPGAKLPPLYVEFVVPTAPLPDLSPSTIRFDWSVSNGQGVPNSQPSYSNQAQSGFSTTPVKVAVSTATKSQVQSYVSVGGGESGKLSSVMSDSSARTTVKVPKGSPVFIEQNETSNKGSCSPLYAKCLATELRIKDPVSGEAINFAAGPTPAFLEITLERATSTLKNPGKADIANAVLTYTDDQGINSEITESCEGAAGPVLQVNCIVRAPDGKKGSVIDNKWVFVLRAKSNGFREF